MAKLFEQSVRMLKTSAGKGVDVRLVRVGNAEHDFELRDKTQPLSVSVEEVHAQTFAFFEKHLAMKAARGKASAR